MGGAYRSPGNTAPTTEWNINVDPDAAKVVFSAWTAAREADPSIPGRSRWASTSRSAPRSTPDHIVALARRAGSTPDDSSRWPAARIRCRRPAPSPRTRSSASSPTRSGSTWSSTPATTASTGRFIHDPLAVAAALDPTLIRTEALPVDIELGGTLTTGETVTDWRRVWGRPPNIDVAVEADAEAFLDRFVERVGRLAAELPAVHTLRGG